MDLYVCGNSGLVQPAPCRKWNVDTSNPCSHVQSGRVSPDQVCPLLPISPTLVRQSMDEIDIHMTHAENIVKLRKGDGKEILHARDAYDRTLEQSSIEQLTKQGLIEDIKDIWHWLKYPEQESEDDFLDDMFGPDYPRDPPVQLGILLNNGAIYRVLQARFALDELTTQATRTPFLHALIRPECHNGRRDVWPTLVFAQQPHTVYRIATITDLLAWLAGEAVAVRALIFAHPIVELLDGRFRDDTAFALLESGEIYHWGRASESGILKKATLDEALSQDSPSAGQADIPLPLTNGNGIDFSLSGTTSEGPVDSPDRSTTRTSAALAPLSKLDLPPISKISIGRTLGAAIVKQTGMLYVFATSRSKGVNKDIHTPHLLDLDDKTPQHRITPAYAPQKASINNSVTTFIDVAVGDEHVVALAADGTSIFAAGSAFQGQLGIGERMFSLDDEDPQCYEWSHRAAQFSETWQQVTILALQQQDDQKVVRIAAGYESTIFVVGIT